MKYIKNCFAAIRRVWSDAPNKGGWTAGLVLNGLALVFLVVLFPEAFLLLNRAVEAGSARLLVLSIALYALSMAGDLLANAYIAYWLDTRHAQLQLSMRSRFISRMFAYPFDGAQADESEVSAAYVHALPAASGLVGTLLRSLVRLAVAAVIVFGYVAWLSPILLAFLLLAGMIRLLLLYRIMMRLDTRARAEQASLAKVTNNITSVMQSLASLKSYDAQAFLTARFTADNEALYAIKKKQAFWSALMEFTNNMFNDMGNNAMEAISASGLGGADAAKSTLAIHNMGYQANPQVFDAAYDVMQAAPGHVAGAQRYFDALDKAEQPEKRAESGKIRTLELRGVAYEYAGQSHRVLDHLDLSLKSGDRILLSGESGCGKSTLLGLIERLYAPIQGTMTANGVPAQEIPLDEWRRHVATLPQVPVIAPVSVRENIRMGRPDAADAEVERAARDAGVHEDIMGFANGYDTVIDSVGGNISTGQAQRIAFARILLLRPDVLLLDEPTSSLDAIRQEQILNLVRLLPEDCAVLCVSHRRTDMKGYRCMTMREGRLSEG